jgi:hypothetical protein
MQLVLALLAFTAIARAQSEPDALLERARVKVQELTKRLDRYVCVETVNRSYFSPAPMRNRPLESPACAAPTLGRMKETYELVSTDRLRVEVTVSQSRELHSWPGATGFDIRDIDQLIENGPVSTGSFALYLSNIFDRPGVLFHYEGEQVEQGRRELRYRYESSAQASRFELKSVRARLQVPFDGEFWIEPETLELNRLTIRASQVPPGTGVCGVASTLDYRVLQIGDGKVILPRHSQLEIAYRDGRASRNDTTFSNCREYQAESEVRFDVPAGQPGAAASPAGRTRIALPLGLPVTLALQESIDSDSAATGDPVSARVVKPVRRAGATEDLIPVGAIVHGRIRRMEHHLLPQPYFVVAIAFNRMEIKGSLAPFAARHEADPKLARELGALLNLRATGIWFWDVGTFLFRTDKTRHTIPAGFESTWFTLAIGGPAN